MAVTSQQEKQPVNAEEIRKSFGSSVSEDIVLEVFDELPSTNRTLVIEAGSEDPKPCKVLVADRQTAGVGRRGKTWVSQGGNISFSILRMFDLPIGKLTGLSLVTGVTVAAVLKELADIDCSLKWPNDVMVDDAKLAGILIEVPKATSSTCTVVTGIGINHAEFTGELETGQAVASISGLGAGQISRERIIGKLVTRLLENQLVYSREGLAAFAQQWASLDYLANKPVKVLLGDKQESGIARGISDSGELQIQIGDALRTFNSGDVSVRKL